MRICCISDTHEKQNHINIPHCDLLIHAGDLTMMGTPSALKKFNSWCSTLLEARVVEKIISIAGNHDFLFERNPDQARSLLTAPVYLQDSGMEWQGIHFWGTPWQPWFFDWAFNLRSEEELEQKFERIPEGTDVLICHGPPKGILDRTMKGEHVGSMALRDKILQIRPRLVVFGHIHEDYGIHKNGDTTYVNASICDVHYRVSNQPVLLEL